MCLECVWMVIEGHLKSVLNTSKRFLEGVWRVSGRCFEGAMKVS